MFVKIVRAHEHTVATGNGAVDRLKKVLKEERLEDPDLAATVDRGCASEGEAAGEAKAADTEDGNDDLFYYRLEHGGNFGVDTRGVPSKAGDGGAEAAASTAAEEEPVELDPDTMLPIVKGQNGLFVVGEEGEGEQEGEEELDPDTMMPVKKTKGPKRAAMRQFVSYRARKLTCSSGSAGIVLSGSGSSSSCCAGSGHDGNTLILCASTLMCAPSSHAGS
jgi:hypothetical protein